MAISKKSSTKPAAKVTSKTTAASVSDSITLEPITVMKTFLDGGERNEDTSEVLEHVPFPANAKIGKVAVMVGTSEDYGRIKASVTVSVPGFIDELDPAAEFATKKAMEILDAIADGAAEPEDEEETKPVKGKREVTSTKKGGKNAKVEEPEEEEEEEDEDDAEDGDGEEVELFSEEELAELDDDQLKALCEQWEIAWPKAKKASVAKAQAIASILEKQEEYAEENGEDGEGEGDDDEEGLGPEDLEAMDRKQLEAFIKEYNDDAEEGEELEVDLSDYPKNAKGLTKLKADLIEALFSEEE